MITATEVTAGKAGDASTAEALLNDMLPAPADVQTAPPPPAAAVPETPSHAPRPDGAQIYGDVSYGTADLVEKVEAAGIEANERLSAPPTECWRISAETERGRWRDEETYFLYVDDSRRRDRDGIDRKTPAF